MTQDEARRVLGPAIQPDGSLDGFGTGAYIDWRHGDLARLDGQFSADQLEAIAAWMRAHQPSH